MFTFTSKYPDEAPLLDIEDDNFDDDLVKEKIVDAVNVLIEENMGMEMIFSLVAGAQELLNTLFDEIKLSREEVKRKKEQEIEEAERKRFEGTRVSVDVAELTEQCLLSKFETFDMILTVASFFFRSTSRHS